jgi:C4-dicarboxylate-specific signal transduction histidine kinase
MHQGTTKAEANSGADNAGPPDASPKLTENGWMQSLLRHDGQLVHAARLAALGEMAVGIVHEMNQPLAAIQMIVTSMLADLEREKLDTGRAREWLGTVNEQIGRISWIIGHIRSFSRNEAPEPMASAVLEETVENTLGLLGAQLRSHGITIEHAIDGPLPPVQGDPRRIEQVLINLLSNARDALDAVPRGMAKTVRITARLLPERAAVLLEVADTGPGMPPEVQEQIFQPFFTTKAAGEGTGLGLSIVRTIVDECGGTIEVESAPGTGTTFRVELPCARAAAPHTPEEKS